MAIVTSDVHADAKQFEPLMGTADSASTVRQRTVCLSVLLEKKE